jgi:hypothetical protein
VSWINESFYLGDWRASLSGLVVVTRFKYSRQNRYKGHVLCFFKSQCGVTIFSRRLIFEILCVALSWIEADVL